MPRSGPVLYRRTINAAARHPAHAQDAVMDDKKKNYIKVLLAGPALYPVTSCWVAGVLALMSVSARWLAVGPAIAAFGIACLLVLLAINHRQLAVLHNDVGVIHSLVNSQRSAMAERIDSLIAALTIAGVQIPVDPEQAKVTAAMRASRHEG